MSVLQGPMRGPMGGFVIGGRSQGSAGGLPAGWVGVDIGAVGAAGANSYVGGEFTISGSGADIYSSPDEFRFVYREMSGDFSVTARIISQTNTHISAKAGPMIRVSLSAASPHTSLFMKPTNGLEFLSRTTVGGSASPQSVSGISVPEWLRATKSGSVVTSFYSSDGSSWTQAGSAITLSFGATVFAGLAVCSHNDGVLSVAVFDNVTVG